MNIVTKTMIRDILAFSNGGMSITELVQKIRSRIDYISHNQVMGLVLELQEQGQVVYDLEVGTWQSTVRLV